MRLHRNFAASTNFSFGPVFPESCGQEAPEYALKSRFKFETMVSDFSALGHFLIPVSFYLKKKIRTMKMGFESSRKICFPA